MCLLNFTKSRDPYFARLYFRNFRENKGSKAYSATNWTRATQRFSANHKTSSEQKNQSSFNNGPITTRVKSNDGRDFWGRNVLDVNIIIYLNDSPEFWRRNGLDVNIFYLNDGRELWGQSRLDVNIYLPEWRPGIVRTKRAQRKHILSSQDKTQQIDLGNRNR